MINISKITITSVLFTISNLAHCQVSTNSSESIFIESTVLDTIETNLNSIEVSMLWLADTISVRIQNEDLQLDTSLVKLLRKTDDSALKSKKDLDKFFLGLKTGGQNCYSYAFEKYFDNNKVFRLNTFGESVHIGRKSAEKILRNYFSKVSEFSIKSNANLDQDIPDKSLLAFLDNFDSAIHFVYHTNNTFYSKNGAFKPIQFQSLKKFLKKHYQDTRKIVIYKIDEDLVKSKL